MVRRRPSALQRWMGRKLRSGRHYRLRPKREGRSFPGCRGGGTRKVVTILDREKPEKSHRHPQFLPGGKDLLFTITTPDMTSFDEARIAVVSLDTGQRRVVVEGGTNPGFVSTGHLVYVRGGSLIAVPFDLRRLEIAGQPARVVDGVSVLEDGGLAVFSIAESGSIAYVRGSADERRDRVVVPPGKIEPVVDPVGQEPCACHRTGNGWRSRSKGRTIDVGA